MTDDLRSLYQEIIVDHNRHPRNFREIPDADRTADGDNPLCGDRLTVYVNVQEGMPAVGRMAMVSHARRARSPHQPSNCSYPLRASAG